MRKLEYLEKTDALRKKCSPWRKPENLRKTVVPWGKPEYSEKI